MRPDAILPRRKISRRRDIADTVQDAYRVLTKFAEPTVCPDCRAVYRQGRWQWAETPAEATTRRCPSCQRVHDEFPAGCVSLSGTFFAAHRDEVMNLIKHTAEHAKAEHPQKRIMAIEDAANGDVLITTTELHLARELGEAVHHAYDGKLDYRYSSAESLLRVVWKR